MKHPKPLGTIAQEKAECEKAFNRYFRDHKGDPIEDGGIRVWCFHHNKLQEKITGLWAKDVVIRRIRQIAQEKEAKAARLRCFRPCLTKVLTLAAYKRQWPDSVWERGSVPGTDY